MAQIKQLRHPVWRCRPHRRPHPPLAARHSFCLETFIQQWDSKRHRRSRSDAFLCTVFPQDTCTYFSLGGQNVKKKERKTKKTCKVLEERGGEVGSATGSSLRGRNNISHHASLLQPGIQMRIPFSDDCGCFC